VSRSATLGLVVVILAGASCHRSIDAWLDDLRHEDDLHRHLAAVALGKVAGDDVERVVPPLLDTLRDSEGDVARAARDALVRLAPASIPLLIDVVRDPARDRTTKRHAATALGAIGAEAVEPVLAAAGELARDLRPVLAESLARAGEAAVDPLARGLVSESSEERTLAAMSLAMLGPDAAPARGALRHALSDPERSVRVWAVRALARTGKPDTGTRRRLQALVDADDAAVAKAALLALVPHHLEALASGGSARTRAARALDAFGMRALAAYLSLLREPDSIARRQVTAWLPRLGPEALEPLLAELADDSHPHPSAVVATVAEFGADAVPALGARLREGRAVARRQAASLLGRLGGHAPDKAVAQLRGALDDPDAAVRATVISALAELLPASLPAHAAVREAAARADVASAPSVARALEAFRRAAAGVERVSPPAYTAPPE